MPDPIQAMLAAGAVPTASLSPSSRYADVAVAAYVRAPAPGEEPVPIPYLRRRICPMPERFALLYEHAVVEGDRRDLIAARQLGDPELWWQLADVNGVINPLMLEEAGRRLRITLPGGVPGGTP